MAFLSLGARWIFALALVCAALSCSSRERLNPLDPENPETQGSPDDFSARAGNGVVELLWFPLAVPGLQGYTLERRGPADSGYRQIGDSLFPPTASGYVDSGVGNDSLYSYRLTFVLQDGGTGGSVEAQAEPGLASVWVGDAGVDLVVRLTPDGREQVLALPGLNNVNDIAVEESRGEIWGSSAFGNFVASWTTPGQFLGVNGFLAAPSGIAPLPTDSLVWIAEEQSGSVTLTNRTGSNPRRIGGFDRPSDVAYDATRATAWMVDRSGRKLVALANTGVILRIVDLEEEPWKLGVSESTGDVWITFTEAGWVERRGSDGSLLTRARNLPRPFRVAIDESRGLTWVSLADGGRVVALDLSASQAAATPFIERPRGVALDSRTGDLWVTALGAGIGQGEVWRLASDGTVKHVRRGFSRPFTIALDPFVN